ncbi:MAG: F0F1 ATP synthase subunit delta [Chloroflexi bacterium]|nr:F0F1 ATP synthase subunit delta [Chloroflexota bacterium]
MANIGASARHYAEAVFGIAQERQAFDAWLGALERVEQILADPAAGQVLTSPAVPEEERRAALDRLLPDLGPEIRNFLHLLVDRGRLELLPEILTAFRELVDQARGVVTAKVTSAVALDPRLREVVARRLAAHTGRQVRLELSVDPELIGGVVARVGDELLDDSVRGRLQRLKERLLRAPVG